jgi:hypothetical protein
MRYATSLLPELLRRESTYNMTYKAQPLEHESFPKHCSNCGKVYHDEIQFFQETSSIPHKRSDIRPVKDDPEVRNIYLEVYRNCSCGSTLMERFHSRRDLSEAGLERRAAFEDMLSKLELAGLPRQDARQSLLRLIRLFCEPEE